MKRAWNWYWSKRWRRWGSLGFVLFLVGSVVSVEVTSQPQFCNSCHIMEPYYSSWKTSAHSDVSCVKCHIEPGAQSFVHAKLNGLGQVVDDVLSRTSFKPSASVTALSCMRSGCHTTEELNEKEIDTGVFKFKHGVHVGNTHLGVPISCGTCHSHVAGDNHFEVNTSVCLNCHMIEREAGVQAGDSSFSLIAFKVREGHEGTMDADEESERRPPSSCQTCHDAPSEVITHNGLTVDHDLYLSYGASCESCHNNTTSVPQPIEDGRCLQCHTFGVDHALSATEMHQIHAMGKHKIECFNCHGMVVHGPRAETMTLEQFDCRKCHHNQHSVQQAAYLADPSKAHGWTDTSSAGDAVNPMFLAHVDCTACHIAEREIDANPDSGATVVAASVEACDRCHQAGMGQQMVPLWQNNTRTMYDKYMLEAEAFDGVELTNEQAELLKEARALLDLVRIDGSWGVHNPNYTQTLLLRAGDRLAKARAGGAG